MADGSENRDASTIFRPEVARRRSNEWLGEVHVSQQLPLRLPILLGLVFIVGGVVFAAIASYSARIPVSGELVPVGGVITVESDMAGTVSEVGVADGASVEAGQVIAILRSPRDTADGNSVRIVEHELAQRERSLLDSLERLEQREKRVRSDAADEVAHLRDELAALQQEAGIIAAKRRLANDAIERVQVLKAKGLISSLEVSRYEGELLTVEASEVSRRRASISAQRQLDSAQRTGVDRLSEIEDQREQLSQTLSVLRQEQAELLSRVERVIKAPIAGRVSARLVEVGQSISVGTVVAAITPHDASLEVVLDVPSQAIASLSEGSVLQLRIEAYPYQRFGLHRATIVNVSGTTLPGDRTPPVYRVRARLDAQYVSYQERRHALLPGMKVESFVMIDYGSPGANALASVRTYLQELLHR